MPPAPHFSPLDARRDFPAYAAPASPCVYLDSAATAPRLGPALDAARDFYLASNANPRRAVHALASAATRAFEDARSAVAAFLGAPPASVVFTSGTTASFNLLARGLPADLLGPNDDLFVTAAEHHSAYLPWQAAAAARRAFFHVIPLSPAGDLTPDLLSRALSAAPRPRLVALTALSNVLGRPQDIPALCDVAHAHGALAVVDAAQSAPHLPPAAWRACWDFLAFSGHKLGAPMGIGVLAGRPGLLDRLSPLLLGGEMVAEVPPGPDSPPVLAPLPSRLEGGTPNAGGAVALAAACRWLQALPPDAPSAVAAIANRAAALLAALPRVRLLAPPAPLSPLFSFAIDGVHPHDVAQILDESSLAVRAGHLCAQPLMRSLGLSAAVRASFYYTSLPTDADALLAAVQRVLALFP